MKHRFFENVTIALCAITLAAGLTAAACADTGTATNDAPSSVDQKLSALSELVGAKYILDIPSAQWTSPEGLGEEIANAQTKYAFEVLDADATALTVTVRLGTVRDGVQDTCNKTYIVTGTLNVDDMTFAIGPVDIQSYLVSDEEEVLSTCRDFTISGQIVEQGAVLVSGEMAAELDTREIFPLFYLSDATSGEALCAQAASVGVPCNACSFDTSTATCLDFAAEDFTVFDSLDLTLVDVPAFDERCL